MVNSFLALYVNPLPPKRQERAGAGSIFRSGGSYLSLPANDLAGAAKHDLTLAEAVP